MKAESKLLHASDCAVHNAPAYPPGPCDCGAESSDSDSPLREAALAFADAYRREFRSAQAEDSGWPHYKDGFDTREPVDAAYLALRAVLDSEVIERSGGLEAFIAAFQRFDHGQPVFHGGLPCFHLETDDAGPFFCGRADFWDGHKHCHPFKPFGDSLREHAKLPPAPKGGTAEADEVVTALGRALCPSFVQVPCTPACGCVAIRRAMDFIYRDWTTKL